ncbi:MAG: S-layer domain protein [Paenibacillaceae bacterium]|jgi:hypothetical protein|nr:S-layer domain protein [Paenibacillaceae bacterium]
MARKPLLMIVTLLTGFCLLLPAVSSAATTGADKNAAASFRLQLEQSQDGIGLSLWGRQLEDVYAYEIRLQYDSARLRFAAADMPANGFSVEPKSGGGSLRLAHTKIGTVAGEHGTVKLADVVFERVRGGEARIWIENVILVDSELNRRDTDSDASAVIPWDGAAILSDMNGHWAQAAVAEAAELGLVEGYGDGTFKPEKPVTRAEFAALLVRATGWPAADNPEALLPFADNNQIPPWAKPLIAAMVQLGIINGYDDGTFRPEQTITRAEMAVMTARALDLPASGPALKPGFADREDIPEWASPAIAAVEQAGIMQGTGAGRFAPLANATRAEAAMLVLTIFYHK